MVKNVLQGGIMNIYKHLIAIYICLFLIAVCILLNFILIKINRSVLVEYEKNNQLILIDNQEEL